MSHRTDCHPSTTSLARRALLAGLVMAATSVLSCGSDSDSSPPAGTPGVDAGLDAPASGPDASESGAATETGTVSDRTHCKRGVAYGQHSAADLAALSPSVSWWYNWGYLPDEPVRNGTYGQLGVEYVPMVWGEQFEPDEVNTGIPDGALTLLGFNEPNFFSQADLSAARATELWPSLEQIATQRNLRLASPAVNYCGGGCHDTDPVSYLDDFFAACPGCKVDIIAVHVYVGCNPDGPNHAKWLIEKLERYKAEYSQPIWLTEFACDDAATMDDQKAFLEDAVTWLESEPRVERYAWFSGRADNMQNVDLLGGDGQLTDLGQAYVSLPQQAGCAR